MAGISVSKICIPFGAGGVDWSSYWATLMSKSATIMAYNRLVDEGRLEVGEVEKVYWDLKVGNESLGDEQSSGVIVRHAVYKITACQTNFFYTGCVVGDTFVCDTVKTCSANNKVQRYNGNHLTQPRSVNSPINGVFNGVDQFMHAVPFTLPQPVFIYALIKQKTWTQDDNILDGGSTDVSFLRQSLVSPQVRVYAGAFSAVSYDMLLDKFHVIRLFFNGANSKLIIDNSPPITGNYGSNAMGGLAIGASGNEWGSRWSNIEFGMAILRDTDEDEDKIYKMFKYYNPDQRNFVTKVAFAFDDGSMGQYTLAYPALKSRGIAGTFFIVGSYVQMTIANAKTMSDNGMDIQSHAYNHVDLRALTEQELRDDFDAINAVFVAAELPEPNIIAYPGGLYNDLVKSVAAEYYDIGRTNNNTDGTSYPYSDRYMLNSIQLIEANGEAATKAVIDSAILYGQFLSFTIHSVVENGIDPGETGTTIGFLEDIIDYVISKNVGIVTMKQLALLMD